MGFFDRLREKLTDQEGLFQGGKYGRIGGRFQDLAQSQYSPEEQLGQTLGTPPLLTGDPNVTQDLAMARDYATDFDPSNPNDVRTMQRRLNQAGYRDEEGNPLAEDAMFGSKTEAALRQMQGNLPMGGAPNLMGYAMDEVDPSGGQGLGDSRVGKMRNLYDASGMEPGDILKGFYEK